MFYNVGQGFQLYQAINLECPPSILQAYKINRLWQFCDHKKNIMAPFFTTCIKIWHSFACKLENQMRHIIDLGIEIKLAGHEKAVLE